jgi:hypothetical protein
MAVCRTFRPSHSPCRAPPRALFLGRGTFTVCRHCRVVKRAGPVLQLAGGGAAGCSGVALVMSNTAVCALGRRGEEAMGSEFFGGSSRAFTGGFRQREFAAAAQRKSVTRRGQGAAGRQTDQKQSNGRFLPAARGGLPDAGPYGRRARKGFARWQEGRRDGWIVPWPPAAADQGVRRAPAQQTGSTVGLHAGHKGHHGVPLSPKKQARRSAGGLPRPSHMGRGGAAAKSPSCAPPAQTARSGVCLEQCLQPSA